MFDASRTLLLPRQLPLKTTGRARGLSGKMKGTLGGLAKCLKSW